MAKKPEGQSNPSVMSLVREALAELGADAKPEPIREYLLKKHQRDVAKQQISTYKSILKRQAGSSGPERVGSGESFSGLSMPSKGSGDLLLQFVSTVRDFEAKLGSAKLLEVIDALYRR